MYVQRNPSLTMEKPRLQASSWRCYSGTFFPWREVHGGQMASDLPKHLTNAAAKSRLDQPSDALHLFLVSS